MCRTSSPPRRDLYELEHEIQTTTAENAETTKND
jgi:antitoxin component of MazEF toxin-antitoxin module